MNTLLVLFATLFACSFCFTEPQYLSFFSQWKQSHSKVYASQLEHTYRYSVFKSNLDFINSHDAEAKGFSVALNQFADQTLEEFVSWANGLNITADPRHGKVRLSEVDPTIPKAWNWTAKGAVTNIKNQEQCGSCWSFSATGSTEGATFLKTGKLPVLSEQNLVDCSTSYGNQGCNGGLMDNAFQYIIDNKGIDTEASYPYTATGPNQCRFKRSNVAATLSSFHDIPQGDETALLAAVYKTPTSVAIDASHQSFQFYSAGVYYEPSCSSTELDHGVLAVGFGTEKAKDYWLVKNSWGTGWGDRGYIKMARNKDNNCGIATSASYPIV